MSLFMNRLPIFIPGAEQEPQAAGGNQKWCAAACHRSRIINHLRTATMNKALSHIIPQPSPVELIRIGGSRDGSYLVPNDLIGIDACFSPGVNNFKDFEDELAKCHSIKSHMCDFSSNTDMFRTPLIDGMQTFKKKWLDIDGSSDSISLKEWVEECSQDESKDLILQIDIEGAEYRNLLAADANTLKRFRIVVIELHGVGVFKEPELLSKLVSPLLSKLNQSHISVHAHPNNCCGDFIEPESGLNIPNVLEVTYLRRDRFSGDKSQFIQPQLPHPLDISWNVRENPPIHLNEKWMHSNNKNLESEVKILDDNLNFSNWERSQLKNSNSIIIDLLTNLHRLSSARMYATLQEKLEIRDFNLAVTQGCDHAHAKKYFLSKAYESYPEKGIVKDDPRFFFHTAIERNQSITIDFTESIKLQFLVIGNRTDACQDRPKILFFIIHDSKDYLAIDALPIVVTDEFLEPGGPKSVTPLLGSEGRYLTIFSPIHTALHFSSVNAY